jgi:putative oxidoreductase
LAPVLRIVGLFTRPAALIVALNMVVAIWLVHQKDLGALNGQGGWALELQGMFLFTAIAVALIGPGHYRINDR